MTDDRLVFNGIDGASGSYLLSPKTPREILEMALGEYKRWDGDEEQKAHARQLKSRHVRRTQKDMGVVAGVDTRNLEETGWGIVFAEEDEDAARIREALQVLLDHRREQAAQKKEKRYREFIGADAHWSGETGVQFLARHQASVTGPVNPDKMPYYLLIVGDPERIPYRFQYELDVQHAVGRIHFETLEEYARYARSVVEAETGGLSLPRQATFFGVANPDDTATRLSAERLVKPLADTLARERPDWTIQSVLKDHATKARLSQLLNGAEAPALLFTASHGMGFPNGDEDQLPYQGALLCQDWPGLKQWTVGERITPEYFFSADDVGDDARLLGLLAFHFACFGAGTPYLNDFAHYDDHWDPIAPHAFVARLPQRLLGHPRGGALAVVGHVDRAWSWSFLWPQGGQDLVQLEVFESAFKRLMEGYPLGSAMEYFNDRYGALSTFLTTELQFVRKGKVPDAHKEVELASLWTANNDARSYVILGDPAVRLMTGTTTAGADRPTISAVHLEPEIPATPAPSEPQPAAEPAVMLQDLIERVGQAVEQAVAGGNTLEVVTYTSDDMSQVQKDNLQGTAALGAITRVKASGDVEVCVPANDGEIDKALWALHLDMVRQAQAHRIELVKTLVEAWRELLKGL